MKLETDTALNSQTLIDLHQLHLHLVSAVTQVKTPPVSLFRVGSHLQLVSGRSLPEQAASLDLLCHCDPTSSGSV